jgi:hypothetical protein
MKLKISNSNQNIIAKSILSLKDKCIIQFSDAVLMAKNSVLHINGLFGLANFSLSSIGITSYLISTYAICGKS